MSQSCVERVIGMLATDEGLRRRFATNPDSALQEAVQRGMELTTIELRSLATLNPRDLSGFARGIDPRLQKTELGRSAS
jgi:hypothetical protein